MSQNSLDSLLQWAATPGSNVLWGWNCIAVMARSKTNLLLAQDYIARFDTGSYLPPINGDVVSITDRVEQHLRDFVMDVPLLSFENADVDASKARLSMMVMGGSQRTLESNAGHWQVTALHDFDPLQGPRLYLEMDLDQVPGTVGVDGAVKLDLKDSDNFVLTGAGTDYERRRLGDFFKVLFRQLPAEKRVFVLGSIEPGIDPAFRPRSFKLVTQRNPSHSRNPLSQDYGDGALVMLIRMTGETEGVIPGASFRYLIPDDAGRDFSATVVFEREPVLAKAKLVEPILEQARTLFEGGQFQTTPTLDGSKLRLAKATAGQINFAPDSDRFGPAGFHLKLYWRMAYSGMQLKAANWLTPFKIELDTAASIVKVTWQCQATSTLQRDIFTSTSSTFERLTITRQYTLSLDAVYRLHTDIENPILVAERFDVQESSTEQENTQTLDNDERIDWDRTMTGDGYDRWNRFAERYINAKAGHTLKEALERQFNFTFALGDLISDIIRLNFSQAIVPDLQRIAREFLGFGRVNPLSTSFVIEPLNARVEAGASLQLSVPAGIAGLTWAVEPVDGFGYAGHVEPGGGYWAPSAQAFEGRFKRVRIIATRADARSVALVSVVRNVLTVNPFINVCQMNESCELAAGSLHEGELQWSVINPQPTHAGSIEPSSIPGGDHTYRTVSEQNKPRGQTYLVDEVKVRNLASGHSLSVHVLVVLYQPELSIRLLDQAMPPGQVQLQAYAYNEPWDSVRWSLPLGGPGSIDQNGVYTADEHAQQGFALILIEDLEFTDAGGHIILPLPLAAFAAQSQRLNRQAPRKYHWSATTGLPVLQGGTAP